MIKDYWDETWKEIVFDDRISEKEKFKISNYGRIKNCKTGKEFLVNKTYINGYQNLQVRQQENGKKTSRYVHKLVAEHFIERGEGNFVIHLNYDKTDNKAVNLKWVTKDELWKHLHKNKELKKKWKTRTYCKLTETQVMLIKKRINDPNRKTRMKMIAKQFGISEMQLYRIKTGENWSTVK